MEVSFKHLFCHLQILTGVLAYSAEGVKSERPSPSYTYGYIKLMSSRCTPLLQDLAQESFSVLGGSRCDRYLEIYDCTRLPHPQHDHGGPSFLGGTKKADSNLQTERSGSSFGELPFCSAFDGRVLNRKRGLEQCCASQQPAP